MKTVGLLLVPVVMSLWTVVVAQEEEQIPWSFFVKDGDSIEMYCNSSDKHTVTEAGYTLNWLRNGEDIQNGTGKYEFTGGMGFDRLYLTVKDVRVEDYGIYYCGVYNSTMEPVYYLRMAINVDGMLYDSLGEKYRIPIITGAVAAAIMLALWLVAGFVYKFRFKEDNKYTLNNDEYYGVDKSKVNSNVFDNPALQNDDQSKTEIELTERAANGREEITTDIQ